MSITLKVTLGTVNYTDFLHVTASKVASPASIAWQTWIDVPVTNYNFIIPGLDADMYYIRYYDAPTDVALGSLVAELVVNALTGDVLYERRFYTVDGPASFDPVAGDTKITDPYLVGKTVAGVFKEHFRPLDPADEYTFDDTTGELEDITGAVFAAGEKMVVDIKYNGGVTSSSTTGGLYTSTLTITTATRTLLNTEINSRVRLLGSGTTQTITLPLLATIADDGGFLFDNTVGGLPVEATIATGGSDVIKYNGFTGTLQSLAALWAHRGEHLLLRKYTDVDTVTEWWEVILDYKGQHVGERLNPTYNSHVGTLPENGALIDGLLYPRLYWWIKNVLPANEKYVDDTIASIGGTHTANRRGQFCVHATLPRFRMPDTQGLVDKGLKNFTTFNTDTTNRPVDYPGGIQVEMVKEHEHYMFSPVDNSGTPYTSTNHGFGGNTSYNMSGSSGTPTVYRTGKGIGTGSQQRVDNNGMVFCRRC